LAPVAREVDEVVACDLEEPEMEARRVLQGPDLFQNPDEDGLDEVVGFVVLAAVAPEVGADLRLEGREEVPGAVLDLPSLKLPDCGHRLGVELRKILEAVSNSSPEQACRSLVQLARDGGGPDNITVLVARLQKP